METPSANDRFHSSQAKKKWDNALVCFAYMIVQPNCHLSAFASHTALPAVVPCLFD